VIGIGPESGRLRRSLEDGIPWLKTVVREAVVSVLHKPEAQAKVFPR